MAKRGRPRKTATNGAESAVEPAVNPANFPDIFHPLDTSWVDQVEVDEIPRSYLGPNPDPDPEPDRPPTAVSVRPVEDADIDRLWDWIREDEDRGQVFLGFQPATARELYGMFATRFSGQPDTAAWAIDEHEVHQGFAMFNPITPQLTATVHLYLAPMVRGRFLDIVQRLLAILDTQYPLLSLAVVTPDPARARLYRQAGFAMSYVLTRKPKG